MYPPPHVTCILLLTGRVRRQGLVALHSSGFWQLDALRVGEGAGRERTPHAEATSMRRRIHVT